MSATPVLKSNEADHILIYNLTLYFLFRSEISLIQNDLCLVISEIQLINAYRINGGHTWQLAPSSSQRHRRTEHAFELVREYYRWDAIQLH